MRRFKPYVDENGQMLSALCGRCNRENSCGYHLTPSEYFHQHPDHLTFVGSDVADLLEHRLRPPR